MLYRACGIGKMTQADFIDCVNSDLTFADQTERRSDKKWGEKRSRGRHRPGIDAVAQLVVYRQIAHAVDPHRPDRGAVTPAAD